MTSGASQLGGGSVVARSRSGLAVVCIFVPRTNWGAFLSSSVKRAAQGRGWVATRSVGGVIPDSSCPTGTPTPRRLFLFRHVQILRRRRGAPTRVWYGGPLHAGCPTAVLPKCPHANCGKRVPNQPLRPRRGRFGKLWGQLQCGIFGRTAVKQRITVYPSQEPQEDGSVGFGRDPNVLPRFRISNTVALSQYAYALTYTHVHRQGALQRLWTRRTTDAGASVASRRTPQAPVPDDGA